LANFGQSQPELIGNNYLVVGTVDGKVWRNGLNQTYSLAKVLPYTADFKHYPELEYEPGGWYPVDQGKTPAPQQPLRS